jgi:tRNA splicing endonuclease
VNKAGEVIKTGIKPGARVRVYYANMGDSRVVDHVVVLD